ncbi:hypothetical protein [Actinacidiphila sp. ITFR-21]|uniref:hypothetical protein n=1 Tax=Actinacidiphila sp. ITFR-21 TaxID=3075199 RepID=UPI00288A1683|nr:hypothetical protein [Streptomyces sp. ITFR-21]WNI15858.1 hypothetical protein RLT57_10195 [Streptomyces sp. ITFR-21]
MAKASPQGASGLALFARMVAAGVLALLLLVAAGWNSWQTAQYVVLTKGREQGTVTLTACGGSDDCTGPFAPKGSAVARPQVTVNLPVRHHVGERVDVVLRPGTLTAVRSGFGGLLFAWVPFGGALLLAAVVVAGGLRMRRTAWTLATAGAALLGGAFLTL